MGAIAGIWLALILGHSALAASPAELSIYMPGGLPAPGDVAQVVVVVHRGGTPVGGPAPEVKVDGQLLGLPVEIGKGRWGFLLPAAGLRARRIDVNHEGVKLTRTLGPARLPGARLRVPATLETRLGEVVEFTTQGTRDTAPRADQIAVLGTDGRLLDIQPDPDGGLHVRWQAGDSPFPRTLALGVVDLRSPQVPPEWLVAELRGRPQIPIQTEPGAKVTVVVGGRASETVTAGEDGVAVMRPEVRPGETRAAVTTEDSLGNTQLSEIALGGDSRPVLTVVSSGAIVPGRRMPHVYVHASRPGGQAWSGEAPVCSTTRAGELQLAPMGPGRWRSQLPPALGSLDAQVICDLGGRMQTRTQVRVETGLPTRLTLRAHPSAITADLPSAEIQAFLENALGDRLPSENIELRAARGTIRVVEDVDPALVRAVYRGDRAVDVGSDELSAGVALPSGSGGVWSLDIQVSAPQGRETVLVDGRALDRHGRPLSGTVLSLRIPGLTREATTGSRGWASVELPWPKRSDVVVAEVAGGGLVRRAAVLPGDAVLRDIGGPDLTASLVLPVLPGRISGVRLVAQPRVVEVGGAPAQVEVHLEDRAGKKVLNQGVEITVDKGQLSRVVQHTDGRFTAQFTPPADVLSGTARIQARTGDGQFTASVDVDMVPRRLARAVGIAGGLVASAGSPLGPYGALEYDHRLPWAPFVFRGSIAYLARAALDDDELAGGTARVDLQTVPISAGVLMRQDRALVPTWMGLTLVGGVHRIRSSLSGALIGEGLQLAPPGFQVVGGAGWRLRQGEIQAQAGYLFIYGSPGAISWAGPAGGVVGTLGYKVLY